MTSQTTSQEDQPFSTFEPSAGRIFVSEFTGMIVTIVVGAVIVYFLRGVVLTLTLGAVAMMILGLLWVVFERRSRRLTIGDSWVSGPSTDSSEPATVLFHTLDWTRSGFIRGRLVLRSSTGHGVAVRTRWFDPEEIAEIKRLMRERCPDVRLPPEFYA